MEVTDMNISEEVLNCREEVIALRRDFHEYPELGRKEFKTAEKIEKYLCALGLSVRRCTPTGVMGILTGELPGKTIMLRSDIDALPVEEETEVPYASKNPGVMHACGHDAHIAMLLTAAKILTARKKEIKGTVVFVFQPDEEDAGAEWMINEGALEHPKPDAAEGLHIWSGLESGTIGVIPGAIMAAAYYFKIRIHGKGGHGAMPYKAVNPIDAANQVMNAIHYFHTSVLDARKPTVISICKIHSGQVLNVIPEQLEMEGSVRCLHAEGEKICEMLKSIMANACALAGCTCDITMYKSNSVVYNDENMAKLVEKCASDVVGKENVKTQDVAVMMGDDFAEFSKAIPGVYYFIGTANREKNSTYEHHNPKFNIDEETMLTGVQMHVSTTFTFLNT